MGGYFHVDHVLFVPHEVSNCIFQVIRDGVKLFDIFLAKST